MNHQADSSFDDSSFDDSSFTDGNPVEGSVVNDSPSGSGFDLLAGNGAVRERMRRHDWSASPLGEPDQWPSSLRTAVGIMLNSAYPMFLAWGAELSFLYNDAYMPILGRKEAHALCQPFAAVWADIWHDIEPLVKTALSGESIFASNLLLVMERNGFPEETYFTFSYSPIHDESGRVAGMFCACTETTLQILSERRQRFQLEMADRMRDLADPDAIAATALGLIGRHLALTRVAYAEVDDAGHHYQLHIGSDWTDGSIPAVTGSRIGIASFGPAIAEAAAGGLPLTIDDVASDERTSSHAAAFRALHAGALLLMPLVKAGRLHSLLVLAQAAPRRWRSADVALAEDVAERIWLAMERAAAEASRRRAEAALSRQLAAESDRLRRLFEQAPGFMAVMRGPRHVFELTNKAFLRLAGRRDMLGQPFAAALPELADQGFVSLLDQVYASGRPFFGHEALMLLKQAPDAPLQEHFVDFIYQPVLDADGSVSGIFIEGYDVTARRLADDAVRDSEERLREGLQVARMVVWDWDLGTDLVSHSFNAAEVLGQRPEQAPPVWEALHPEDREQARSAIEKAIMARGEFELAVRIIRPDNGLTIWLETRGKVLLDAAGEPALIRGISIDITERKRAEDALRAADRRKDEFLAMLAHELRNPLAPISTAAQLLKLTQAKDPQVKKTSEIISRQVDHMTSLVDDLLDVSRVTRGLITLQKEALPLEDVVMATVEQVRALIEERRHRLAVELAPGLPPVLGDRTRLIQVCTNLLNNAAKYTPPGGEIQLRAWREDQQAVLTVRDTGIGISPELLPHVFDLFTQGERSPDRAQGGLGLGLALVKSLVELHGGKVAAESRGPGCGSLFTVRLPLAAPAAPAGHSGAAAQAAEAPAGPPPQTRIMLVDDNADAANTLALLLQLRGYAVTVAYDARSALAKAKQEAPRICLLDIGLPEIDGYQLARQLRAQPETAGTLLIALTGYGQAQDRARSEMAGFDHHLVKPVHIDQLIGLLARVGAGAGTVAPAEQ